MSQLEQVTIIAPSIDFTATSAASTAAKRVLYLENMLPSGLTLPNPTYITGFAMWNQMGTDYPSGTDGDISVAIDPGKQFVVASGFPATESIHPKFLKMLGVLECAPGAKRLYVAPSFNPPLAYRPYRDCIIVAPEVRGGVAMQVFLSISFMAEGDIAVPAPEAIPEGASDAYRITLDTNSPANGNLCIRNMLPIVAGGTEIRAHLSALDSASVIGHASVGLRSGTSSSTLDTPVELKFGGVSGVSLAAHSGAWSDWVSLSTSPGQNLLLTVSQFGGTNNRAFKTANGDGNWNSASDSWNTAAMQGTATWQADRTHIVDRVQVR